jgi:hypothetical protein
MVRVYSSKLDVFAKVVSSLVTEETMLTGNTWLNGHSVT